MTQINETSGLQQTSVFHGKLSSGGFREGRPSSSEQAGRSLDDRVSRAKSQGPSRQSESDYVAAFRLVQRASEAIDILQERCRRLEIDVKDTNERLKSEAESSERVIKDWERLANAIKAQLSKSEATLAETLQKLKSVEERATGFEARAQASEARVQASEARAQASEARAQSSDARAKAAEQLAAQEGELASSFRDTILETFGSSSRLSSALAGESGL